MDIKILGIELLFSYMIVYNNMRPNTVTKSLILNWIKNYYDKHNDFPKYIDFKTRSTCPFAWSCIYKHFKSFKEACEIATGQKYTRYNSPVKVICKNCDIQFMKSVSELRKTPNSFCSQSCAAIYNNKHKEHGTKRSKLEIYIEKRLKEEFPNLRILYNNKSIIHSELDIYFPDLKIAVELNGIFHYEPIYGHDKLEQIQNNDKQKMINCYNQRYRVSNNRLFKICLF